MNRFRVLGCIKNMFWGYWEAKHAILNRTQTRLMNLNFHILAMCFFLSLSHYFMAVIACLFFPQFENYVASLVALVITYRSNMEPRVLIIMRRPAGVVDCALCFHPVHPYSNVVGVERLQIKTKRNALISVWGGDYCVIDAFFLLSSYLCCL